MMLRGTGNCKECGVLKTEVNTYICFNKKEQHSYLTPRCKECHKAHMRQHRSTPEQFEMRKKYMADNKEYYRELNREAQKKKRMCNPTAYRIINKMRIRVNRALEPGKEEICAPIPVVGCTPVALREHIEKKFKPGMTWENRTRDGWHLDHILPISAFDLSKKEHVQHCFHYSNLQPLWAAENVRKSNSIPEHIETVHLLKLAS